MLKPFFSSRRNYESNLMSLTKATVTQVQVIGMGDRVCVDLCSLMRPGDELLISVLCCFVVLAAFGFVNGSSKKEEIGFYELKKGDIFVNFPTRVQPLSPFISQQKWKVS